MKWDPTQVKQLQNSPLFKGFSDQQLSQALANTQVKEKKGGEVLFAQGELAERFYWLRTGLIKLYRLSPSGEEKIIEIIRPGQTFAEAIMFAGKPSHYHVSAQFIEDGEAWCFSNQDFKEILRHSVDTCFRLMTSMSQRLHKHVNEIDRLTLQTAAARLINYLLQNKQEQADEVRLLTSKQTLAAHLSIKPETLSRTLSKLTKEGLIKTEKHTIHLLDLDALRARVEV